MVGIRLHRAVPLFLRRHQSRIPADLGFYDLRPAESRIAQAKLAKAHGVDGFCYWRYWFNGRRLLERPVNEVLKSRQPVFHCALPGPTNLGRGTGFAATRTRWSLRAVARPTMSDTPHGSSTSSLTVAIFEFAASRYFWSTTRHIIQKLIDSRRSCAKPPPFVGSGIPVSSLSTAIHHPTFARDG